MRSKTAPALCVICTLGFVGAGLAGEPDATLTAIDEDTFFSTDSVALELDAAAASPAPVEKTGQKTSYASRDDGALRKGVAWPKPRFRDNGNGTVRDKLTGLVWLKNANCVKFYFTDTTGQNSRDWDGALTAVSKLKRGYCSLTDGSIPGNWRLPNVKELQSLIAFGFFMPALSNTAGTGKWSEDDPFSGVQSLFYWSSTTYVDGVSCFTNAWPVYLGYGSMSYTGKLIRQNVWPVRGR